MALTRSEINRRYRERHPERELEDQALRALRHPRYGTHPRTYWDARPGLRLAYNAKRQTGEWVAPSVMSEVSSRPCFDCGKSPAGGVDHIVPFSRGGRNVSDNLQPSCPSCNSRKGGAERRSVNESS